MGSDVQNPEVYSVPRRYDLATLFVVSSVFAVLFGGLRFLRFPPTAALSIGSFIVLIGIAQAILFRGARPRMASVLAGGLWFLVLSVWFLVRIGFSFSLLAASSFFVIFGGGIGYLTGALIGGVFLVADHIRRTDPIG